MLPIALQKRGLLGALHIVTAGSNWGVWQFVLFLLGAKGIPEVGWERL